MSVGPAISLQLGWGAYTFAAFKFADLVDLLCLPSRTVFFSRVKTVSLVWVSTVGFFCSCIFTSTVQAWEGRHG